MAQGDIVQGVMAVHKPEGITSSNALRTLQQHFNTSTLFAPLIEANEAADLGKSQHSRRRKKSWNKHNKFKIGHGGTLDPLATGVLIVAIGSGTKQLGQFLACKKQYDTIVVFGAESDSYDVFGKVTRTAGWDKVGAESIRTALQEFHGKIQQRPPIFSARWVDGERAYDIARRGGEISTESLPAKEVQVDEVELLEYWPAGQHAFVMRTGEELKGLDGAALEHNRDRKRKRKPGHKAHDPVPSKTAKTTAERPPSQSQEQHSEPDADEVAMSGALPVPDPAEVNVPCEEPVNLGPAARIRMTVSTGFYVRSLCHDLGQALGSAAVMAALVRTRQAGFALDQNTLDLGDLDKGEHVWGPKVKTFLQDWQDRDTEDK